MDSSVIFPKCAKKCLLKIIFPFACVNKKPEVEEEEFHDGGHQQPRMGGGDSNWVEQFRDSISTLPRIRSIEVTFEPNSRNPMDDYYYNHEYDRSTRSMPLPEPVPVPPHAPRLPPHVPLLPPPPRAMPPPPLDYDYGPPGPFMESHHHAYGVPPLAYYNDY